MKENIIQEKSKAFAVRIVKFYKYLCDENTEIIKILSAIVKSSKIEN
nr:hypothetical protein [uncultured Treponema sp.]